MRWLFWYGVCVVAAGPMLEAQRSTGRAAAARPPAVKTTTDFSCAADLGAGVRTAIRFCDVVITKQPTQSISIAIPPHTGDSTIRFDLHNRFDVPAAQLPAALSYARHEAFVAVIRPNGELIGRALVRGEFRTMDSLFDQIGGGGRPGGVKAVAPGPPESISIPVPAALTAVGIVGTQLSVTRRSNDDTWDTPGRPVALVSRVRVEYRPR